jgi:cobalt-zinc-cadmium efflux system membrane fusion protein
MKRIVVATLLAVIPGWLAGCAGAPDAAKATAAVLEPHGLTAAQMAFLKFAPVAEVEPERLAELGGTIDFDEQRTARLTPAVPSRVAELLVQVGDHVEADQPLVALDSPDLRSAEADYVRAESDLLLARKATSRADRLREARAIAEKDYIQAHEDARKAEADFEKARAALERLHVAPGEQTSRYLLRAPFAGTVVERKALVGMTAGPETTEPLVVVSDLSAVRVVLRVPERQLSLVRAGEEIAVRVDAYPEAFPGQVVAIGDVVDEATRTVPVRCAVLNADHLLKPAMFARVTLKSSPGLKMLAVPASALLSDGEGFRVIVRKADGSLETRPVEVGADFDGRVQVLSGVQVGENVVTDGALFAAQALSG